MKVGLIYHNSWHFQQYGSTYASVKLNRYHGHMQNPCCASTIMLSATLSWYNKACHVNSAQDVQKRLLPFAVVTFLNTVSIVLGCMLE